MLKILVVEDDWEMNRSICYILEENGYETVPAHSIVEAQKAHEDGKADLVLLDVNLPDGEGFGFCEWLRKRSRIPVLFLTARDLEGGCTEGAVRAGSGGLRDKAFFYEDSSEKDRRDPEAQQRGSGTEL